MTGGRTTDLSGGITFLERSQKDDEQVLTSVRCERRILTQEAHLKVETPESV
jgi:hypothetical protein